MNIQGLILETNAVGSIEELGDCAHLPNAVTNIISLYELIETQWVTFDSQKGPYFTLHKPNGDLIRFQQSENGLFYFDPRQKDLVLLNSQYENSLNYSNEEIERAKKARNLYAMLGYPSIYDFKMMVKNNMLMNCPVNEKDIDIAEKIFGPDIHGLKGKRLERSQYQW